MHDSPCANTFNVSTVAASSRPMMQRHHFICVDLFRGSSSQQRLAHRADVAINIREVCADRFESARERRQSFN